MERKFQIGVMGSAADLEYAQESRDIAYEIGKFIAQREGVFVYGAEKDVDSLPTVASRGAKDAGGLVVGITYGSKKDIWEESTDIVIPCNLERGGGRETVLVNSCDSIIAISGGSGTLTELAIAYQANIPTVALKGYGGWADKLAGTYIDDRRRRLVASASSAEEAVDMAFEAAEEYRNQHS